MTRRNDFDNNIHFAVMSDVMRSKFSVMVQILLEIDNRTNRKILIIGCGDGLEAIELARELSSKVHGIDIDGSAFPIACPPGVELTVMDARSLRFADNEFDLIFTFHALEHIVPVEMAMVEISRVLKVGGWLVAGTPNRSRLVGYIGSDTTLFNKIRWNANDWSMRLRGKWSNAKGAHAGFSERELIKLAEMYVGATQSIGNAYYMRLYRNHQSIISFIIRSGLRNLLFPAVYVKSQKRQ